MTTNTVLTAVNTPLANQTLQGNNFNGNNQLLQANGSGFIPLTNRSVPPYGWINVFAANNSNAVFQNITTDVASPTTWTTALTVAHRLSLSGGATYSTGTITFGATSITIPETGTYSIHIVTNVFSTLNNAIPYCQMVKNATTVLSMSSITMPAASRKVPMPVEYVGLLTVGDIIDFRVGINQASGTTITIYQSVIYIQQII